MKGKIWDPESCQCLCPLHTIQACSTGFMFDLVESCECVQVALKGTPPGVLVAVVVVSFLLTILFAAGFGIICKNHKRMHEKKRIGLMSQKSKKEFETESEKRSVSLKQFDNEKKDKEGTSFEVDESDNKSRMSSSCKLNTREEE